MDWRYTIDSHEESLILEKLKRRRPCENNENNEESEDRLSGLSDCVLLYILSFLYTKHAVRTCVLSTRWKHLWKHIPTLTLHSSRFSNVENFDIFVSKILTLRDTSTAMETFDLDRRGVIEPQLLKKVLEYVCSHNTYLQELGISIRGDSSLILSCVSSCQALTSLKLSIRPSGNIGNDSGILFPNFLNLPPLTSLNLTNFAFSGDENGCAEPFSVFIKLNSLVIRSCKVKDAQILSISSETLVNLDMHDNARDFAKIELSTPSLCTFTFSGRPVQKIRESGLSSVKHVSIDAEMYSKWEKYPWILFNWLLGFASVKKFESHFKYSSVEPDLLMDSMLRKAAKTRKAFEAGWRPPLIPDGIIDFLLQNPPSAKLDITTEWD